MPKCLFITTNKIACKYLSVEMSYFVGYTPVYMQMYATRF